MIQYFNICHSTLLAMHRKKIYDEFSLFSKQSLFCRIDSRFNHPMSCFLDISYFENVFFWTFCIQVSISSTIYQQFFFTIVLCAAFQYLPFVFGKGKKVARKMLLKLTTLFNSTSQLQREIVIKRENKERKSNILCCS